MEDNLNELKRSIYMVGGVLSLLIVGGVLSVYSNNAFVVASYAFFGLFLALLIFMSAFQKS